jgi:hypothetical protein
MRRLVEEAEHELDFIKRAMSRFPQPAETPPPLEPEFAPKLAQTPPAASTPPPLPTKDTLARRLFKLSAS